MQTLSHHLTRLTLIAAIAAAGFAMQSARAAEPAASKAVCVVQLPTVTVTAKRVPVIELPRVVIVAKRLAPAPTVVAQSASGAPGV